VLLQHSQGQPKNLPSEPRLLRTTQRKMSCLFRCSAVEEVGSQIYPSKGEVLKW
jgi:hypothetical protein